MTAELVAIVMSEPILTLDKGAFDQVWDALGDNSTFKDYYLRVGVKGGGCSGFTYEIDLVRGQPTGRDIVFHQPDPESVYVSGISTFALPWTQSRRNILGVCYSMGRERSHGRIPIPQPPGARSTCGCGHSFTT